MRKNIFVIFVKLILLVNIFPEVIILKNEEIIKGEIISQNEEKMRVNTSYGEVIIDKEDIKKVFYEESDYIDSKTDENDIIDDTRKERKNRKEFNDNSRNTLLYNHYKSLRGVGIGLLIPGLIITGLPLVFATPPIAMGFIRSSNPFEYDSFCIGFAWYVTLITVGVLFDISAIICLISAGSFFSKWLKRDKFALQIRYENNSAIVGVRYKF